MFPLTHKLPFFTPAKKMIPVIRRPSNRWRSSVSLVSESESTTIKSIKIRVGHFKVKAVVVRWVQGVTLVRLRRPNTGEIRVQRHVGNPGVQIRERARAEVADCRRGSGSAHQQINRLHCLSVADGAVTQTAHGMCTASAVLWTGRIPACWIGWFHRYTHTHTRLEMMLHNTSPPAERPGSPLSFGEAQVLGFGEDASWSLTGGVGGSLSRICSGARSLRIMRGSDTWWRLQWLTGDERLCER